MEENMEAVTPEEGSEGGVVTAETGAEAEETAGEKKQEAAEPARQSREENARYQAARKAGESAGFRRAEERYQNALAKLGLSDPDGGGGRLVPRSTPADFDCSRRLCESSDSDFG